MPMMLSTDSDGRGVELLLDTKSEWNAEWIRGERADIALYRDCDTGQVVGCFLPLMSSELVVCHDGPIEILGEPLSDTNPLRTPIHVAPFGFGVMVSDRAFKTVAKLEFNGEHHPGVGRELQRIALRVAHDEVESPGWLERFAEVLGVDPSWSAVSVALQEIVDERDRMRATIGELRAKLARLESLDALAAINQEIAHAYRGC